MKGKTEWNVIKVSRTRFLILMLVFPKVREIKCFHYKTIPQVVALSWATDATTSKRRSTVSEATVSGATSRPGAVLGPGAASACTPRGASPGHFIVNTGSESKTLRSKDHGMIFKMTLDPEFLIFYNAPLALQGHHPQCSQAGLIRTQLRRHRRHRCRRLQPIQGETVLAVS